jgi:hypothetical protein
MIHASGCLEKKTALVALRKTRKQDVKKMLAERATEKEAKKIPKGLRTERTAKRTPKK